MHGILATCPALLGDDAGSVRVWARYTVVLLLVLYLRKRTNRSLTSPSVSSCRNANTVIRSCLYLLEYTLCFSSIRHAICGLGAHKRHNTQCPQWDSCAEQWKASMARTIGDLAPEPGAFCSGLAGGVGVAELLVSSDGDVASFILNECYIFESSPE